MIEGRYTRIRQSFWMDEKVHEWSGDTKLLALYLLTSPHNNMLGCFFLPRLYICGDLGWEPGQLSGPFNRLLADGFIKYDEKCRLVMLANYLKHNPLHNGNRAKAAIKLLQCLPKSRLLMDLKAEVEQQGKPYLQQLAEALGQLMPQTPGQGPARPTMEPLDKPTFEPIDKASAKPIPEPIREPFANVITTPENFSDLMVEPIGEPYGKPLLEPLLEPLSKPLPNSLPKPLPKPTTTTTAATATATTATTTATATTATTTATTKTAATKTAAITANKNITADANMAANTNNPVNTNITTARAIKTASAANISADITMPLAINAVADITMPAVKAAADIPMPEKASPNAEKRASPSTENRAGPGAEKCDAAGDSYAQDFEYFWSVYPRQLEKRAALSEWQARVKEGAAPLTLIMAARHYGASCRENGTEPRFIKHPKTFLGPGRPYEDYILGPIISRPEISREPKGFAVLREYMSDLQREGRLQ